MKNNCNFTYKHYREILKLLKKQNYKNCFFSERPDLRIKKVYLRHDIDFSLDLGLPLAKLEHEENVQSIYFIRLAGSFYNVFKPKNIIIIEKIINFGHQIGLHFEGDPSVDLFAKREPKKEMIEQAVEKQIKTLKNYFKVSKVVSFHCPHLIKFILNKSFNNFTSTYSSDFFSKAKYLSDSSGTWREGCICKLLNSNKKVPSNLHLLMHPIWWGERKNINPNQHYYKKLKGLFKELDFASAQEHPFYKQKYAF